MSHEDSLILALVFAAIVAALHALGPRLRAVPGIEAASGTSLSGGLAAAYVFVHVLPELARGNQQIAEQLQDDLGDAAATEVGVFLVALLGFFVFFVLQWAAEQPRGDGREPSPAVFAAMSPASASTAPSSSISCRSGCRRVPRWPRCSA